MALHVEFPDSFSNALIELIKECYTQAYAQAKQEKMYFTIQEACDNLNVSRNTLELWISQGLDVYKVGNKKYIATHSIHQFMEQHKL